MDTRERLVALDKQYVWHPYTEMSRYRERAQPLVIAGARGSRLYDVDGRSYLDGNASWWTALLGHGHPRVVAALKAQAEALCHVSLAGMTHEPAAELAAELVARAPEGQNHVFFSDNGSTAIEAAMKMAVQYWYQNGRPSRRRFLALEGAFHGDTIGVTALGGVEVFRRPFAGLLLDCVHVAPSDLGATRALDTLERLIASEADTLAAVVLEPCVQAAAGMRLYDPRALTQVRELCTRHDVFLIADEVFTGYGRTGPMWACDHAAVRPDITCVAKGFTAGTLPMAATLVTDRIFEGFLGEKSRAFYYGHTFCGNPLGARVALEVLRIYRDEQVLEKAAVKAQRIAAAFAEFRELPGVTRTRSLGMIGALDLDETGGYLSEAGWRVYEQALARGAYLRPLGNVVYITPPLTIADQDLDELLEILAASVRAAAD